MTTVTGRRFLADTSAWIEYLRATGSAVDRALTRALRESEPVAVTGIVIQEVLAGSRSDAQASEVRRLLAACPVLEPVYPVTYEHAAGLYRRCRAAGRAVRGTVDCLIAAVALEHRVPVLARDRDIAKLHDICGLALLDL